VKKNAVIFILTLFVFGPVAGAQDAVSQAQQLIEIEQYSKAFAILDKASQRPGHTPLQRAQALEALAKFFEKYIGNHDGALRRYTMISREALPLAASARNEVSRLKSLKEKYATQDKLLKRSQIITSSPNNRMQLKNHINELNNVLNQHPDYYRAAEVYYHLACCYMLLEMHTKALDGFDKALKLKPCIDYYLQVTTKRKIVHDRWLTAAIKNSALTTSIALMLLAAVLFYLARPWQWLNWKHIAAALATLLVWCALFYGAYLLFAWNFKPSNSVLGQINAARPAFISAKLGAPGSNVTSHLFLSGCVGTFAMFVFAVGTARLKRRWIAKLSNPLFGLLLFAALTTIFYIQWCNDKAIFTSEAKSLLYYPGGSLYFLLREPEPYILTNPKAYPNLNLRNLQDQDFKEWLLQHCPFDDTSDSPNPLR